MPAPISKSTTRSLTAVIGSTFLGGAFFVRSLLERMYKSIKAMPPTRTQLDEEDLDANPLYRLLPALRGRLAWRQLGNFPTPVHQFSCALPDSDVEVQFWVKREDLSSPVYGGNKVRTLQYQLASCEAELERCAKDHVKSPNFVVLGSGGSNQNIATKAHAAAIKMPSSSIHAVTPLPDEREMDNTLNFLSSLSLPGSQEKYGSGLGKIVSAAFGSSAWVFNAGGNGPLGVLGQVGGIVELAEQIVAGSAPDPYGIVVALGSSCTVTGLILGVALVRKMGIPAFARPGFRIFAQPVHPALIQMHRAFGLLKSESMPPWIGRGLREAAAIIHSLGGPNISAAALRVMREELTISTDISIAGQYGAHSDASRRAKQIYDKSVSAAEGVPDLWLCGHFSAKSFALLLKLLEEDKGNTKHYVFWQTKSSVQPLGPLDEWAAWEQQCRSSGSLASWGVVGGVCGTGHTVSKGKCETEHRVVGPHEYRPLMTPVLRSAL